MSSVAEALRGCSVVALGCMRYVAVASPDFVARQLPKGLTRGNFAKVPWLVFNRKDDMDRAWASAAFGVRMPRLNERFVPSTEAHVRAAAMGWGVAVMPEQMAAPALAQGRLLPVHPEITVDVLLHWHQWKLRADDDAEPAGSASALDRIGQALAAGARQALRPAARLTA